MQTTLSGEHMQKLGGTGNLTQAAKNLQAKISAGTHCACTVKIEQASGGTVGWKATVTMGDIAAEYVKGLCK
jgi:hypothetical protein